MQMYISQRKNKAIEADSHKHELGKAPGRQCIITYYIKEYWLLLIYIIHINTDNLIGYEHKIMYIHNMLPTHTQKKSSHAYLHDWDYLQHLK